VILVLTLPVGDLFSNAKSLEQGNIESVKYLSPSSFKTLCPFGYNEFRTKVVKEKTFASITNDKKEFIYEI
jgi:ribosomal protein L32E